MTKIVINIFGQIDSGIYKFKETTQIASKRKIDDKKKLERDLWGRERESGTEIRIEKSTEKKASNRTQYWKNIIETPLKYHAMGKSTISDAFQRLLSAWLHCL